MRIDAKYVDDIANTIAIRRDYRKTKIITDSINIEIYNSDRRIKSENGKDELGTRVEIPLGVRNAKNNFKRNIKLTDVDYIIGYLKGFLPETPNVKVWVDVVSLFLDKEHKELYRERYYGSFIDSSNFEEKINEIYEILTAFCKNTDLKKNKEEKVKVKKRKSKIDISKLV